MRKIAGMLIAILMVVFSYASISIACEAKVGSKAPDFTTMAYLPIQNKFKKISLSSYLKKGKWVILFFYPADFTFA